jgi:hypothetical protein
METINSRKEKFSINEVFLLTIFILLVLTIYIYFAGYHFDLHHDGLILSSVEVLLDGKLPVTDDYQFYGLTNTFTNYIFSKIFGFKLYFLRLFYISLYIYIYLITYLIARKSSLSISNALVVLLFFLSCTHFFYVVPVYYLSIWPSVIALALSLTVVYLDLYSKNKYKVCLISIIITLLLFSKINYGLIIFAAYILSSISIKNKINKIKDLFEFLFLMASILILCFILMRIFGIDQKEYLSQSVLGPFKFINNNQFSTNHDNNNNILISIYLALFKIQGHGGVDKFMHLMPFINILGLTINYECKNSKYKQLFIYGFLMWFLYYPIPGLIHIFHSIPINIILFAVLTKHIFHKYNILKLNYLLISILSLYLFNKIIFVTYQNLNSKYKYYNNDYIYGVNNIEVLDYIKIDSGTLQNLNTLNDIFKSSKVTNFVNLSNTGFYNLVAKKHGKNVYSLAPYNYMWDWGNIGQYDYYEKLKKILNDNNKDNIILSTIPFPLNGYKIVKILPISSSKQWDHFQDFPQSLFVNLPESKLPNQLNITTRIIENNTFNLKYFNPCPEKNCLLELSLPFPIKLSEIFIEIHDPYKIIFNNNFSESDFELIKMQCPDFKKFLNNIIMSIKNDKLIYLNNCLSNTTLYKDNKKYYSFNNNLNLYDSNKNDIEKIFFLNNSNKPEFINPEKKYNKIFITIPIEYISVSTKIYIRNNSNSFTGSSLIQLN